METDTTTTILANVGAALAALSALSTAAFGVLDSSKAFWGGISNVGLGHLWKALTPFEAVLKAAVGDNWKSIVRANWINGVTKAEQKTVVGSLLKLGLSAATAPQIAAAAHVDATALTTAATNMESGAAMTEQDLNILGRMTASVEAQLDAAFERAEQQYRNVSRLFAGAIAIALALWARELWIGSGVANPPEFALTLGVGLLAIPVAPVAKDLTSALSSAMRALKAAKAI